MPMVRTRRTPDPITDVDRMRADAVARVERGERARPRTLQRLYLTRVEKEAGQGLEYPEDIERPRTRGDCVDAPRPCPYVSCKHHLYLDVVTDGGNGGRCAPRVKLSFPHLEVDELKETCSLDVADRGSQGLEQIGDLINVTRERVRQIEVHGLAKGRRNKKLRIYAEP